MLVDTHAHIHFDQYADRLDEVLASAVAAGVTAIVCVGVDEADSAKAVELASRQPTAVKLYATVGLHPHDAGKGQPALDRVAQLARGSKAVAIGECGLDYFKQYSPKADQEMALRFQIELALELNLPMVWHVREAFDDFFKIVDEYQSANRRMRGIVHCFTSNRANMERAVERGFLVAFNGIMTFTKDTDQLEAARQAPLQSIVLETDCPFLAPAPLRGQINEPANLQHTAAFLAQLRRESYDQLAQQTSTNARSLLRL